MSTQPEALLEAELVAQLRGMGYGFVSIQDETGRRSWRPSTAPRSRRGT